MPFWLHGRDAATGAPRDSLFIETDIEADARQQAADAGMTVEEVELVSAAARDDAPTREEVPPQAVAPSTAPAPLRCARCNSPRVVPRAAIWDNDRGYGGGPLQAYVNAKPDALIFREAVYANLYARICADCGHAELFADGAKELYDAHKRGRGESGAQ